MEKEEKDNVAAFVLSVLLGITVFVSLVYSLGEESRYIEKRDAWFHDKLKTALLLETANAAAVEESYIRIEDGDNKTFFGPRAVKGEAKRVRQEGVNALHDRLVK